MSTCSSKARPSKLLCSGEASRQVRTVAWLVGKHVYKDPLMIPPGEAQGMTQTCQALLQTRLPLHVRVHLMGTRTPAHTGQRLTCAAVSL